MKRLSIVFVLLFILAMLPVGRAQGGTMTDHWVSPIDQQRMGGDDLLSRLDRLETAVKQLQAANVSAQSLGEIAPDSGAVNIAQEVTGLPSGNLIKNPSFEVQGNPSVGGALFWTSSTGSGFDRDATTVKHGLYSGKLTRSGGVDNQAYQDVYVPYGSIYVRNGTYTFGAWVYATVASRARLIIDDGSTVTYSEYHPGDSSWQWMTVTATIGAAITTLKVGFQVDTGDTSAYIDAAALTEGSQLAFGAYPTYLSMPRTATMWHDQAGVISGNPITKVIDTAEVYNTIWRQVTAAQFDTFTQYFYMSRGTYTFHVLGQMDNTCGQVQWSIDGTVVVASQDWYNAATVRSTVKTATVDVPSDGIHVLQGEVISKNAGSAGFRLNLIKYWID